MISGGSAGGYTTLCALTPEHETTFRAGASYYGVSDLAALARETHEFRVSSTTFLKPVSPVLNQIGLPIELTRLTVASCCRHCASRLHRQAFLAAVRLITERNTDSAITSGCRRGRYTGQTSASLVLDKLRRSLH